MEWIFYRLRRRKRRERSDRQSREGMMIKEVILKGGVTVKVVVIGIMPEKIRKKKREGEYVLVQADLTGKKREIVTITL